MDETQRLDDSFMDDRFELDGDQARKPLAKLRVFKNEHIPETELPLYIGENVMGRDPTSCSLPLDARSVSKRHAVISLSVFPGDRIHVSPVVEALVWDLGSMNGTRKGRFRLTPHVRYALTDGDSVVLADLPCQYIDTSEVLREGSAEPERVVGGGELPAKGRGRSLRTRMGKESESTEGGWSNGIKNVNLKGNVKGGRMGNETVTPSVVRSMSLSLAQTPACPDNLHVLELDSDSDDSTRASKGPTCSTFLSPMNSIVPESEDENSVTPSSSVKDNSHQRMNQGGKGSATTKRKPQILVYDSDSEFEERETLSKKDSTTGLGDMANEQEGLPEGMAIDATPNGRAGPSENVGMDKSEAGSSTVGPQPCKPGSQVSSGGGSHTADNEEEQKDPPQRSDPHSLGNNDPNNSSIQDGSSASKPSLSMDSDTDVECKQGSEQVLGPVSGTEATDRTCKSSRTSMVQPEEFHLDSDTDIEDNEDNAPMSPSTISLNVKPSSTTVIVPTKFHLDSDTDSKGSEDLVPPNPKPSTGLTEPLLVKCPGFHLSSDTDDEATDDDPFATSVRKTQGRRGTEQPAGGREVDLKIDSSSDSDVESNATQLFAFTSKPELGSLLHQPASHSSPLRGAAHGYSSDSDTDVEELGSVRPGPGPRLPSVHLCLESDTDVEDGGEDGAADTVDGTDVLPVVASGAMASGVVDQKCSTPVTLRPPIPPVFPSRPSEGDQDDLKDDNFFIAETQSFVSEAPGGSSTVGPAAKQPCVLSSPPSSESSSPPGFEEQPTMVYSFQLGLSDSGHERPGSSSRPPQLGLIAEDELSATQAYTADTVTLRSGTVEMDRDLEATQAYIMEAAGEADGAVKICTNDIMNIQEVVGGEDHQRDFQANSHLSTSDTQPVSVLEAVGMAELVPENEEEEEEEGVRRSQLQRQRGSGRGNEEDKQPGRSTRSQRRAAVDQEPQKRETRRISKAGGMRKGNGSRRKAVPDEDVKSDMEEDESVQETSRGTRRTRGRKSQKKGKDRLMMSRGTEGNEGDEVIGEEWENSEREDGKRYKKKEPEEREERARQEEERKEQEEKEERERLKMERKEQEEREEKERLDKERKDQEEREERERLEKEKKELEEREERKRLEKEKKEREEREEEERLEKERLEKERKEQEEREKLEKERKERERLEKEQEEREKRERLEKERLEKERKEQEEREKLEKERKEREWLEKEREEREKRERLEKERLEKERKEQEEREKLEKERKEREWLEKEKEREERERLEEEKEREERERLEKEREEREERERLEKERKEWEETEERERLEKERLEKERKEQEEREKLEKERKERERLGKEKKEREERERLEKEREETEERERLEEERKEKERLEKEKEREEMEERERLEEERKEKERLEKEKEREEMEERERLEEEQEEREERERLEEERKERERLEKEQERRKNVRKGKEKHGEQVKEDEEDLMKEQKRKSTRGKRKQEQVCKEREKDEEEEGEEEEQRNSSQARGKRTRGGFAVSADEPRPCDNDTAMPEPKLRRGTRASSRCNLVTSVNSEKSTSSIGTQERSHLRKGQKGTSQSGYTTLSMQGEGNLASSGGMGSCATSNSMGTSPERAMQTENVQENNRSSTTKGADTEDKETHHSSAKASQVLDRDDPGPSMNDGGDCKGGKVSPSDTATTEADQTIKDSEADDGKVLSSRSKSRSRSQKQDLKGVLDEVEQANSFKVPMDRRKSQRGGKRRGEELDGDETGEKGVEGEIPQPAVKKGISGAALAKKMKQEEREEAQGDQKEEQGSTGLVQLKSRGRQAVAQKKKERQVEMSEEQETKDEALDPTSEQDGPGVDIEVPQTPVGRGSRKRVASSKSPLAVKTPRRSSVQATSPTVLSGSPQAPKVLFTCVTDEAGEAALSRLGGSLARGVADMTHLVTDKVRRTVKFLCAVARGVPVITPCWLEKCSKNGAFLSPQAFLVKDVEQERKFNFCLEEALQTARAQPLLQGYEIHVTRSVKPDPAQMKDIITCSGARYLSRMPTVLKPQTVVISCAEDASLCGPALAASIPVLSAEFLLTGILQQKVDLVTHSLIGTGFAAPENEIPKGRRKR
ncbi:mediator of DNA damage checkpoint protein 1 isoform X2 [Paramormyrops kingsleyae]|uniref:mediator of DNA damage checkpoint protein 1 isoform X2 n=1 Tax=Paramormyrops kingsleyae TaxID=1676925 RepID=UPI003B973677